MLGQSRKRFGAGQVGAGQGPQRIGVGAGAAGDGFGGAAGDGFGGRQGAGVFLVNRLGAFGGFLLSVQWRPSVRFRAARRGARRVVAASMLFAAAPAAAARWRKSAGWGVFVVMGSTTPFVL